MTRSLYIAIYSNEVTISIVYPLSFITAATGEQNFGKQSITKNSFNGFYCENVNFSTPFQNGGIVRVFPSLSHEDDPGNQKEALVAVVDSVGPNSFSICLMEPAPPTGKMTINWFAISDRVLPLGVETGSVSYNDFTSGSVCNGVTFARVSFIMLTFSKVVRCFSDSAPKTI